MLNKHYLLSLSNSNIINLAEKDFILRHICKQTAPLHLPFRKKNSPAFTIFLTKNAKDFRMPLAFFVYVLQLSASAAASQLQLTQKV